MSPSAFSSRALRAGLALAAAMLGSACGSVAVPEPCTPQPLALRIHASPDLNPTDEGVPLPTQIRLFQLAEGGAARAASFEGVWRGTDDGLAEDIVSTTELTLIPGAAVERWVAREGRAQFLMAAARVRRPEGQSWRDVVVLAQPGAECRVDQTERKALIEFWVGGYTIEASGVVGERGK